MTNAQERYKSRHLSEAANQSDVFSKITVKEAVCYNSTINDCTLSPPARSRSVERSEMAVPEITITSLWPMWNKVVMA